MVGGVSPQRSYMVRVDIGAGPQEGQTVVAVPPHFKKLNQKVYSMSTDPSSQPPWEGLCPGTEGESVTVGPGTLIHHEAAGMKI